MYTINMTVHNKHDCTQQTWLYTINMTVHNKHDMYIINMTCSYTINMAMHAGTNTALKSIWPHT